MAKRVTIHDALSPYTRGGQASNDRQPLSRSGESRRALREPRRPSAGREREAKPLAHLMAPVWRRLRQRPRLAICIEQGRQMRDFILAALREYLRRRQRG